MILLFLLTSFSFNSTPPSLENKANKLESTHFQQQLNASFSEWNSIEVPRCNCSNQYVYIVYPPPWNLNCTTNVIHSIHSLLDVIKVLLPDVIKVIIKRVYQPQLINMENNWLPFLLFFILIPNHSVVLTWNIYIQRKGNNRPKNQRKSRAKEWIEHVLLLLDCCMWRALFL